MQKSKSKKTHLAKTDRIEFTIEFSSKIPNSKTRHSANNDTNLALNNKSVDELNDIENSNKHSFEQIPDLSDLMNKKIEDFVPNELNLSFSFSDKVITAQSNLRNRMYQNNRLLEETGVSSETQELNQNALAEYQMK